MKSSSNCAEEEGGEKKVFQTKAEKEEEKQDGSVFPFFFPPFSKHASYAVLHIVLAAGHENMNRRDATRAYRGWKISFQQFLPLNSSFGNWEVKFGKE